MKYLVILFMVIFLSGCDDIPEQKKEVVRPHAESQAIKEVLTSSEPVVQSQPEPIKTEAEIAAEEAAQAAKEEKGWETASRALAKLTSQDIEDLDLIDTAKNVRSHFARKKLTEEEKSILGVD